MKTERAGFTIAESLVAFAVFLVVISIGMGGFAQAIRAQRRVAALIAARSSAAAALEQMAREMRTGYLFCNDAPNNNNGKLNPDCAQFCTAGGQSWSPVWTCDGFIDFYNSNSERIRYLIGADRSLQRSSDGGVTYVAVAGGTMAVKYLKFTIFGATEGDHWPPRVTISMGVAPNSSDPAVANDVTNLQTTVSARLIDCTAGVPPQC